MVEFILDPGGGNELTLTEDDIVSYNPVLAHTAKGDIRATLVYNRSLDDYAQRQNRLNVKINGSVQWTGYITGVSHSESRGTARIRGDGIAKKLEETKPDYANLGGSLTIQNKALDTAIDDYWDRTDFSNHSVTSQSTETVATNSQIQNADTTSELNNILSIANDVPLQVSNGVLERVKSSIFKEAEDGNQNNVASTVSDSAASDSQAVNIIANGQKFAADNFTTNFTIPASDVQVVYRKKLNGSTSPGFNVLVNGEEIASFAQGAVTNTSFDWTQVSGISSDLAAGDHNVRIEIDNETGNNDAITIDCVALQDGRESYTLDNSVDSNNNLSGPEPIPSAATTEFQNEKLSFNVTEGTINITGNDQSNGQKIQLSFDGGSTYVPTNGDEDNTTSVTDPNPGLGRQIRGRVSLDGFGSRTTQSPTKRFNGQTVDTWELLVDGNDRVVIDSIELSRNHFDNLKTLHSYGGFLWTIEHDSSSISNLTVTSYQEGDESRTKPSEFDDPIEKSPEVSGKNYFNKIFVQGAKDSNGNRPKATLTDSTAVSNDDRTIQATVRDEKITTEAGATFRARALLNAATDNDQFVGSITVTPTITDPGYTRPVDLSGDGNDVGKTVERVSLQESNGQATATFQFTLAEDISRFITRNSGEIRRVGDQV